MIQTKEPRLAMARAIAKKAHRGQTRRGGEDYINHPERVAEEVEGYDASIVALLHDAVEDAADPAEVRAEIHEHLGGYILELVNLLTKPDCLVGLGDYMAYIDRLSAHRIAREVKKADIRDNLRGTPLEKQKIKYWAAYGFMTLREEM